MPGNGALSPPTKSIMEKRTRIDQILKSKPIGERVTVKGWVRSFRNNQFIALNDGSDFDNLQIVIDREKSDEKLLRKIHPGAAVGASGVLTESGSTPTGRAQEASPSASAPTIVAASGRTHASDT